ncbi:MAG: NADH-quinone oxidoreductase subunit G [Candidatus Pseudothioglobus sp.]|jgi:NADH-quinone oxidoreductase subunit G
MTIIHVDGREYTVKANSNLLDALLSAGIDVPYFCWHPALGSVGACRQCAVTQYANDDDQRGRLVMSCMTPVVDQARFSVTAANATGFRQSVIENLMINHPHDCPVCEEGGECHLQDMTVMVGHHDRHYEGLKRTWRNQQLGPLLNHEMNRCITCYRCVRFYQDYAGGTDLAAFASRDRVYFGRADDGVLENEFAGNLAEVCPTGVFTDKPFSKHYTRKWDLQSAPTVCVSCSLGCNTYTAERDGLVRRVQNRFHAEVNGYFLCDRGRFGADFVNSPKRLRHPGQRRADGLYDVLSPAQALENIRQMLAESQKVIGIGSPRASLEANQALYALVGDGAYCNGMDDVDRSLHGIILGALQSDLLMPTLAQVETFDAVLILGEDITNHAPRLALAVRQAARNEATAMAAAINLAPWQDAAVRGVAQQRLSPVMLATPALDRLDDIACLKIRLVPEDIAKLGLAVAQQLLDGQTPDLASYNAKASGKPNDNTSEKDSNVADIARLLVTAKKPLIISGTSSRNTEILKAAVALARTLRDKVPTTGLFLCASECNSLGVAQLDNQQSLTGLLADSPDMVIILENDMAMRLGPDFQRHFDRHGARPAVDQTRSIKNLVVIDHLDNATISASDLFLPAATFAETQGTYVNSEGRAQRSLAVFDPSQHTASAAIRPSYAWLTAISELQGGPPQSNPPLPQTEALRQALVAARPSLAPILGAAEDANYRLHGRAMARQPARYSGRTAIHADTSVFEHPPTTDTESALAFSMEGEQQQAPASLRSFVWSPGWNSNQGVIKFQTQVGGTDRFGQSGALLFDHQTRVDRNENLNSFVLNKSEAIQRQEPEHTNKSRLLPQHHIFGSEPLTSYAPAIAALMPAPYMRLTTTAAKALGVKADDGLVLSSDAPPAAQTVEPVFRVIIDDTVPGDCLIYPLIPSTWHLLDLTHADLARVDGWQAPGAADANLIATDRGT